MIVGGFFPMIVDLSAAPFSEALRRTASGRRSGDLQVQSGRTIKKLFFDHGALVFAASNVKNDRLGESLVQAGRLTPEQFAFASRLMRADKRRQRFGDALQQAGLMSEREVGRAVAAQVQRIVLSLFDLRDGVASLDERPCPIPPHFMVGLSAHRLMYAGIRKMRSPALIQQGLGSLDRSVRVAKMPPFRYAADRAPEAEREVLTAAQHGAQLRALVTLGGRNNPARMRIVYALLAGGLLVDRSKDADQSMPMINVDTREFAFAGPAPEMPAREVIRAVESASPAKAEPEKQSAPAAPPAPPETAKQAAPEAAPTRTEGPSDEELLDQLNRAEVHEGINDYASAIKIYAQLVAAGSTSPAPHLRLGKVLARFPKTAREAERHFVQATRLAPDDPNVQFDFGRYYESIRNKGRARERYRNALTLDPRHREARLAFEALAPKENPLGKLKKLWAS